MSISSGADTSSRVTARYWIETARSTAEAAAVMAREQSTGTFVRVAGETDELRERFGARIESLVELGEAQMPALPGAWAPQSGPGRWRRAEVTLSWPLHNFGPSLPNLLATIAGNLWVLAERNTFCESNASVIASARECLTPMFPAPHAGCEVVPVFSSGQSALQAPDTYRALGSIDLIHACGGIMGHPGGVAAGVRSLHQGWEAVVSGIPLAEYAGGHRELAEALTAFGR